MENLANGLMILCFVALAGLVLMGIIGALGMISAIITAMKGGLNPPEEE